MGREKEKQMKSFMQLIFSILIVASLAACSDNESDKIEDQTNVKAISTQKPNIVIFYVDDLGYGDLSSYGATKVQTPSIDKLAKEGIRYTDAHSPAATCTPSRYSLLTGELAIRNNAAILPGDAPLIIDPNKPTLPKMLSEKGYTTGVVGKWHLGVGRGEVNWNEAVKPGPLEIGFDYSFLMPATGDRVPTVYLENHHVVNLDPNDPITISYEGKIGDRPTGTEDPELLKQKADLQHSGTIVNGISRIGWMKGGKSAEWIDEEFYSVFTNKAIEFIENNKSNPFMLFFPFHDIHVPRSPNAMFAGATGMGPRGDAILQVDWMTGQIVNALRERGILENTLIIFSSDNGPVLDDGYADQAVELIGDHQPAGPFGEGKYSAHEGGTRVPMITYFANQQTPGISNALMSHIDLYASLAKLVGYELDKNEAIDSKNVLPALLHADEKGRQVMVEEAFTLALRDGDWKYIAPFEGSTPGWLENKDVRTGISSEPQLYNLKTDIKELNNLAKEYPQKVADMASQLNQILARTSRG